MEPWKITHIYEHEDHDEVSIDCGGEGTAEFDDKRLALIVLGLVNDAIETGKIGYR